MIYLDNNATTGVDPLVKQAMLDDLSTTPANPSAVHFFGQEARNRLMKARQTIAQFLKVKPTEIIFSSGGTESLNMLLRPTQGHIITSNVEHSAVYNTLKSHNPTYLPVNALGAVTPEQVKAAIRPDTKLITLTAINNETGVKTDIEAIAKIAQEHNIPFVVDGVALLGKELFTIPEGVSAMAFSGHKFHAPKGIGFAFIRSNFKVPPLITGGDQEYGKRAGTENLSGILGMAKAIELLQKELPLATNHMRFLRDLFEEGLREFAQVNGDGPRSCNVSNLYFPGVDGESLLIALDQAGIAASHGSACASGALEPSRILINMGYPKERVRSSLRFSLSRWNSQDEINQTLEVLLSLIPKLKK